MSGGGANGRIKLERARALGPRWVLQPKIDGVFAVISLDARGRVERILSRAGKELPAAELRGARLGAPGAVLVGELEAWTERALRAVAVHGYVRVHLYDVVRDTGGRYVGREPYHARRDLLWRMQTEAADEAGPLPWTRGATGPARSRSSGRYVEATPTDWRLAPIVPQVPIARIDDAWGRWGPDADGEGLVAVNLDAPLDARRSKLKIKLTDELECVVVSVGRGAITVDYRGHVFAVSARGDRQLTVGDVVSVAHEGWQEKAVRPRFARLARRRPDLVASAG